MFQTKDTEWLNEYKSKIHIYAAYKRCTSESDWKLGDEKRYSMQMEIKRKPRQWFLYQTLKQRL